MTNALAVAITTLGYWLAGDAPPGAAGQLVEDERARQTLLLLAGKAHAHLHAGITQDMVERWWPQIAARVHGEVAP